MSVFLNKEETELVLTCNDGCGVAAHIVIDKEDHNFYAFMSYMNGNFYKDQNGVIRVLVEKLKKIWAIIRNKDIYYSDIIMTKTDFETFKEYINRF